MNRAFFGMAADPTLAEPSLVLACRPIKSNWKEVCHETPTPRRPTIFFETMSKRRKGFPSESNVKRGVRIVHGDKLLEEKLGRNDPCPCGSGERFKRCCLRNGRF